MLPNINENYCKKTAFLCRIDYLNSDAVGRLSRSLAKPSAGLLSPPAATCSGPPLFAGGRFPAAAPAPGPPGDLDRPALFFSPAAGRGVFGRAPPSCDDPVNPPDAPVRPSGGPSVLAGPLRALPPTPLLSGDVSDVVGRASATSTAAVFTPSAAPDRPFGFPDANPPGAAEALPENIPPPLLCVMLG